MRDGRVVALVEGDRLTPGELVRLQLAADQAAAASRARGV
jgi:hypothetical protein